MSALIRRDPLLTAVLRGSESQCRLFSKWQGLIPSEKQRKIIVINRSEEGQEIAYSDLQKTINSKERGGENSQAFLRDLRTRT